MTNPIIADNKPVKVNLAKGQEYHFCTCGRSRSQPFCDGSHAGTAFRPRVIVSDMSFGALSEEAKIALAKGAELAGTGICSGEGGMLPEEQAANSRYFYELASAKFGYNESVLDNIQAFHFKGGQGAKTGTGGHLPAAKNIGRIAEVRGIPAGQPARLCRTARPGSRLSARAQPSDRTSHRRIRKKTRNLVIGDPSLHVAHLARVRP
jgi:hypothetical protein